MNSLKKILQRLVLKIKLKRRIYIRDRFNEWYQTMQYSAKPPKAVDLYEYLNKACGKYRNKGINDVK